MERKKITITDEGTIIAPQNPNRVRMSIGEIASLLGICYPTAKRHIRAIEKSGIADGDYSMCCVADGYGVHLRSRNGRGGGVSGSLMASRHFSAMADGTYDATCPQNRTTHRRATPGERKDTPQLTP